MQQATTGPPATPAAGADRIEPTDLRLLSAPIDFLIAEHYRQRGVLALLDRLVHDQVRRWDDVAGAILAYLRRDLVWHVEDEERDLFPILLRRAKRTDSIEAAFKVLSAEHQGDELLADAVEAGLAHAIKDKAARSDSTFVAAARSFTENQRRHLAWENALILPLARKRLSAADQRRLAIRMAKRRQVSLPDRRGLAQALAALKAWGAEP